MLHREVQPRRRMSGPCLLVCALLACTGSAQQQVGDVRDGTMASVLESIESLQLAQKWNELESRAWVGYVSARAVPAAVEAGVAAPGPAYFLSLCVEAVEARSPGLDADELRRLAEYRVLIHDEMRSLRANDDHAPRELASCLQGLAASRRVGQSVDRFDLVARWEEMDGDRIAALPIELQRETPLGWRVDDMYYRAAIANFHHMPAEHAIADAARLLTKMKKLAVARETPAFHAVNIADRASDVLSSAIDLEVAVDAWLESYSDDKNAPLLLNRLSVLMVQNIDSRTAAANGVARDRLTEFVSAMNKQIDAVDAQQAKLFAAANGNVDVGDLPAWRRSPIRAQLLLTAITLETAESGGVVPADELADFIDRFPTHPALPGLVSELDQ